MEVHHHTDLHHKRKKFSDYFKEFLMIFLAVTLGFFAESFREHLTEKNKEREYMKEIVENLKYDSIRCSVNIKVNQGLLNGLDSFRTEIKKAINGNADPNALYYFAFLYGGQCSRAVFNSSAIKELKNSGSLHLVSDKNLMNLLTDYYERKQVATESFLPSRDKVLAVQATIFSLLNLDRYVASFDSMETKTYRNQFNYPDLLEYKPALQLLKMDPKELENLYNEETQYEINLKNYNFWLNYCKNAAIQLSGDIRQVYHFNEE